MRRLSWLAALVPAGAWACSFCANTQLHQRWWLLGAAAPATIVLLIEALAAPLTARAEGRTRLASRGLFILACGAGLVGSFTAPVLGALAMSTALLVRALVVAGGTFRGHRGPVLIRLGALALGLLASVASAVPALRDTDEVVSLLLATPFRVEDGSWAVDEARRRPGAVEQVEARLSKLEAEDQRRRLVGIEVHALLGGPEPTRAQYCPALRASSYGTGDGAPRVALACPE